MVIPHFGFFFSPTVWKPKLEHSYFHSELNKCQFMWCTLVYTSCHVNCPFFCRFSFLEAPICPPPRTPSEINIIKIMGILYGILSGNTSIFFEQKNRKKISLENEKCEISIQIPQIWSELGRNNFFINMIYLKSSSDHYKNQQLKI